MKELQSAVRQYQHNDCSGLVMGYDEAETNRVVSELLQERNELSAKVERLQGAASGAKDMLIECANQFRAIGYQDGHGNFADKHAMYVDRVLSETPTQSLEAVKRSWKETLAVHCYEYSFLSDDRAVEQSILVSEVLSFEP